MRTSPRKVRRAVAVLAGLSLVAAACGDDADDAGDEPAPAAEDTADDDMSEEEGTHDSGDMADDEMSEDEMSEDEMSEEESEDEMSEAEPADEPVAEEASMISDECNIPNPAEEIEIDVMGWEFPIVTAFAEELEDCEDGNYSFNYQFLDSVEARSAMTTDAATGSPTFELYQGSNAFIAELANQGFLIPLNDLIDKYGAEYGLDQIDQAFYDMASVDGNIYSIPMVSNTMHLFYNEPALTEAGVEVPTTFDEAFAACAALREQGQDVGFMYMLSATWAWQIEFDSVLGSLGGTPIDPATGQPNFQTPEAVQAANLLKQMWEDCAPDAAATYSLDDYQAALQTGEIVLGHTWASRAGAMDDPEASTVVGDIQYAPALDAGGNGVLAAPAYIDGWGIPTGTPEELIEPIFLAMVAATDQESMETASEFGLVTRGGIIHPNGPRDAEASATSLVNGRGADLTHPAAGIARAKLGEALITILDGTPVEEALAAAEEAYLAEAGDQGLL